MRTTSWTGQCAAQEAACEAASQGLVTKMEHENKEGDLEDAIRELDFLGSGEDGEASPDPRGLGDALEKGLTMSWKAVVCGGVTQQGILADLGDVDGLIPKVTVTPLGTSQPLPHKSSFGFSSTFSSWTLLGEGR